MNSAKKNQISREQVVTSACRRDAKFLPVFVASLKVHSPLSVEGLGMAAKTTDEEWGGSVSLTFVNPVPASILVASQLSLQGPPVIRCKINESTVGQTLCIQSVQDLPCKEGVRLSRAK